MSDRPSDKRVTSTQESLQPQRIGKEEKAYQSVLDIEERLQKGDATNIALTGPYGSGKSSILITLKDDFPEHHYLNISLATLKPADLKAQDRRIVRKNEAAGLLPPIVETEDGLRVTHYVDVSAQVRAMGAEERMTPVLEHVLKNHRVTNADVQRMLGVSRATAMRLLQKLDGVLEPVGHGAKIRGRFFDPFLIKGLKYPVRNKSH